VPLVFFEKITPIHLLLFYYSGVATAYTGALLSVCFRQASGSSSSLRISASAKERFRMVPYLTMAKEAFGAQVRGFALLLLLLLLLLLYCCSSTAAAAAARNGGRYLAPAGIWHPNYY
jgi:hypothetical protein